MDYQYKFQDHQDSMNLDGNTKIIGSFFYQHVLEQ